MNKEQKENLRLVTCGILDRYSDMDEFLEVNKVPKKLVKKINKALDLIFEVNQSCIDDKN